MSDVVNQTLFVGNIDMQVRTTRLKPLVYEMFSPFGAIMDIVVKKIRKKFSRQEGCKVMAFVVYEEKSSAMRAKKEMNGFRFFRRELDVHYARTKSDAVALNDGTYNPRQGRWLEDKNVVIVKSQQKRRNVGEPSTTLIIHNVPSDIPQHYLEPLFIQFPQYDEMSVQTGRGFIKVKFLSETAASTCLGELQDFNMGQNIRLSIKFG